VTGLAAATALGVLVLTWPGVADAASGCRQHRAANEPACNPALPDSPWGVSHRNSYAQASSPYAGLASPRVRTQHVDLPGIPIQTQFSGRYRDGGVAAWGSLIEAQDRRAVFKVDVATGRLIDLYVPAEREANPPPSGGGGITGSYNLLDRDGRFIVPRQRDIEVFADARRGKRFSRIRLVKRFRLPDRAFCRPDDRVAGATMTYDGFVAFATEQGVAGTVPRRPARMKPGNVRALSFNGDRCGDPSVSSDDLEEVSNSIAADEDGGIYIVTSKRMRRVDHDARRNRLTSTWSARYEPGSGQSAIRLGLGSGSTPTLMGTGRQDKFVVITDGRDLMHVNLFWRDRIPRSWRGLGGGRPRRMACDRPVRFGDPDARFSLSEQSVTVRGYATFHVDNYLRYDFSGVGPGILRNALAALRGGDPRAAPYGAERIDWSPRTRRCRSRWANPRVSIPNAIPSMSSATRLAYGVGQRNGSWGVQALDWKTGRAAFFARARPHRCSATVRGDLERAGTLAVFADLLRELPQSCENSFYSATEVGPGGTIWTGTFNGLTIYRPRGRGPGPPAPRACVPAPPTASTAKSAC
jgi:hypothetical protein